MLCTAQAHGLGVQACTSPHPTTARDDQHRLPCGVRIGRGQSLHPAQPMLYSRRSTQASAFAGSHCVPWCPQHHHDGQNRARCVGAADSHLSSVAKCAHPRRHQTRGLQPHIRQSPCDSKVPRATLATMLGRLLFAQQSSFSRTQIDPSFGRPPARFQRICHTASPTDGFVWILMLRPASVDFFLVYGLQSCRQLQKAS